VCVLMSTHHLTIVPSIPQSPLLRAYHVDTLRAGHCYVTSTSRMHLSTFVPLHAPPCPFAPSITYIYSSPSPRIALLSSPYVRRPSLIPALQVLVTMFIIQNMLNFPHQALGTSLASVKSHFARFGLLDKQVRRRGDANAYDRLNCHPPPSLFICPSCVACQSHSNSPLPYSKLF
jgi:hypothetical protein